MTKHLTSWSCDFGSSRISLSFLFCAALRIAMRRAAVTHPMTRSRSSVHRLRLPRTAVSIRRRDIWETVQGLMTKKHHLWRVNISFLKDIQNSLFHQALLIVMLVRVQTLSWHTLRIRVRCFSVFICFWWLKISGCGYITCQIIIAC